MDEALRILATYETLGIKELWLTPHIMEDIPNTPKKLTARFNELKAAYTGNITLYLAAEYMIDNNLHKLIQKIDSPSLPRGAVQSKPFQETPPLFRGEVVEDRRGEKKTTECLMRHELSEVTEGNQTNNCPSYVRGASDAVAEGVETNKLLPIGTAGKHILVETSYFTPPMRLHETLQKIKSSGYHPLLAHPERYMYMEKSDYIELNKKGVKFQLNIISLAGGYGNTVKKKAEWLLSNGLYSVAGSDLHCEDAIGYITLCKLGKKEMNNMGKLLAGNI
jgi:tyrosine-protein phosphatase YwqE